MIKERHPYWTQLVKGLRDPEFDKVLSTAPNVSFNNNDFTLIERFKIIKKFEHSIRSKLKSYVDLSQLKYSYAINGITEGLNNWICDIETLGILKNEYTYYERLANYRNIKLIDIDNYDIDSCDKVVISCPFSYDGNTIVQQNIIYQCAEKNIPILVDLGYLGTTDSFNLDISKNEKIQVVYSMSKHYALPFDRIGMLWSSQEDQTLDILNQVGYVNITAIQRAQLLINNFEINHIYKTYKELSDKIMDELELKKTNCVLYGHKENKKYCITEYLHASILEQLDKSS